jgi:hypothetical protein
MAALGLWLVVVGPCRAQSIGGGEFERAMRPGPYVPYEGEPFSHRYGYDQGPVFYLNGDAGRMYYLEYLDRLDRAERFGYPPPAPPTLWPRCYRRWR